MAEHAPLSPHGHPGAVVTIRDLRVGFGNHPAVNGVDLDLQPGALHVLLGPSGAGKTTVINALTGMVPRAARRSGRIDLVHGDDHWDLMTLSSRAFRSRVLGRVIGTTIQGSVTAFTATRTLRSQLREAMRVVSPRSGLLPVHPHLASSDDEQRIRELCWAAGAEVEWLDRYPHELSGGQLSRLGLVAAMIGHPPVLLADVALALLSKAAPSLNIFQLGFPVKIMITLSLLGLTFPLLPPALDTLIELGAARAQREPGFFEAEVARLEHLRDSVQWGADESEFYSRAALEYGLQANAMEARWARALMKAIEDRHRK